MDASLVFDIDSSQARGAAKALAELNSAVIKTANSASRFEKTLRSSNGQFQSTGKYLRDNLGEIESLAKAYNPLLAAQIAYRDESIRTGVAVKAGVITEQQRIEILGRTKAALDASANAAQRFGQSQEIARHHVSNLSFQLNDIGMMMATGQNPFMLMMQQGPQVAQIIGQMSQEGRKLGPTLAGAFRMFLNPTTAVTLALIGGAAALGQWAMAALGADKETKNLADSISDLKSNIDGLGSGNFKFNVETGKLEVSLKSIVEKYGAMNGAVERHIKLLQEANAAAASYASLNFMAGFEDVFSGTLGILTTRVDEVRIAFGTTNDTARELIYLMEAAGKARGITAQREAAETLRDRILVVTGGIQNMTAEQVKYFVEVSRSVDQLRIAETQLSRNTQETISAAAETAQWASAMSSVLSYVNAIGQSLSNISGTGISIAAARVEAKLLSQGKSLREAGLAAARETARLEGEKRTGELQKQYGLWGKVLGAAETAAKQLEISEQASLDILRDQARERERAEAKVSRKGGGGSAERRAASELRAAEKGFQSLRELMEKESLFQFAEYDKRQAQLDAALAKRLLSEQEYQKVSAELRTMYFGSAFEIQALNYQIDQEALQAALDQKLITEEEYYRKRKEMYWANLLNEDNRSDMAQDLSNTAQYFGQLTALTGNSYDTLGRLQKSFAASAALVNAYLAASQTLADPTLGYWAKMAAYGKVLAAGLGLVGAIKGGGKSGGGSSAATATQQAQREPTRYVTINWDGPDWMRDGINGLLDEIYEQSKDGRVIIAQERR